VSEQFSGRVTIVDNQGREVFNFDSQFAVLDLGALGNEGDLRLRGDDGEPKIRLDGGRQLIAVTNAAGETTIGLDGNTGDIRLVGADCAEDFDTDESEQFEPGSVMTIGDEGRLRPCTEAYDRRVAGVVSGAGGFHPGIVMDSRPGRFRRAPVALTGKAHCRVDAGHGPIDVGDLLTTSTTAGHAMRAADASKAFGATLGKALQPLGRGTGLIPILIALQ
jgi:hypothetical protein